MLSPEEIISSMMMTSFPSTEEPRNSSNNGQIKRVANSTFIITPYTVDIMGDLLDELENNGAFY